MVKKLIYLMESMITDIHKGRVGTVVISLENEVIDIALKSRSPLFKRDVE